MAAFDNLRKKLRRRRVETFLLAGYAFAVTCALFLSLLNKSSTQKLPLRHLGEQEYEYSSDILTPAFNDSVKDNPFEHTYNQINNLKLLSENEVIVSKLELYQDGKAAQTTEIKPEPETFSEFTGIYQKEKRVLVVSSGDTFIGLLTSLGMDNKHATEAYNTLKKVYDARSLKVGQHIELTATFDVQSRKLETLDSLEIEPERGTKYILRVNEYDKYEAVVKREKFTHDTRVVTGTINGTVANSLANAGVPRYIANAVINNMSHMLDFRTALHKGDSFIVKYDVSKATDGEIVKSGNLLSASLKTKQRTYKIYRYKNAYYDDKGQTKKTGLDIKPLAMRNARISSLFGYRRHPIYKTTKYHNGVDYAAPKGTAIFASGNGVVQMAQYVNGYGNYIKIRHNAEYETAYGHMQKFASGIRPGVKVRKGQVIGYVGSTGRSTGPHLHFEILRKGQRINPLKAKVATGSDLGGAQLAEFKRTMRQIDNMSEKIKKQKTAEKKTQPENTKPQNVVVSEQPQQPEKSTEQNSVAKSESSESKKLVVENIPPKLDDIVQQVQPQKVEEVEASDKQIDVAQEKVEENTVSEEAKVSAPQKKVVRPPLLSAATARQKHSKVKTIRAPQKKPKYAKR